LCLEFNQLEMLLEKDGRFIHKIIALLHLATSDEVFTKEIDQTPSEEMTGYFDNTLDNVRTATLHRGGL
jgi:hypothetical protein